MSWECPECGYSNKDYLFKCVCGYDLDYEEINLEAQVIEPSDKSYQGQDVYPPKVKKETVPDFEKNMQSEQEQEEKLLNKQACPTLMFKKVYGD